MDILFDGMINGFHNTVKREVTLYILLRWTNCEPQQPEEITIGKFTQDHHKRTSKSNI